MSRAKTAIAILGAGRLAQAMADALGTSGVFDVRLAARHPARASRIARGLPSVRAVRTFAEAVEEALIVLFAVSDRSIAALAKEIAPLRGSWRGVAVLHGAGAYGPELLARLKARGASTGVCHPLAVLPGVLAGCYARVEGDTRADAAAKRLCAACGLTPMRGLKSNAAARRRYHAAASLASNDVAALLATARDLLVRDGASPKDALRALTALATGAVAAIEAEGFKGGLTGPVARNDAATLARQLEALEKADPLAAIAHRALSLRLVAVARSTGHLDAAAARGLSKRLARGLPGPRTV
jgi:predicted short-subunit dehydrogenase-like oxidoreductase (DUF2520 family)